MRCNRSGTACLAALNLVAAACAVQAEPINWRQTSVAAGRDGQATLCRGVTILGAGEPVTMTVRLAPLAPPKDGRMLVQNDMSVRIRTRTDVDALVDGAMGDYFAVGEADVVVPR